jgi:hypothetical protein
MGGIVRQCGRVRGARTGESAELIHRDTDDEPTSWLPTQSTRSPGKRPIGVVLVRLVEQVLPSGAETCPRPGLGPARRRGPFWHLRNRRVPRRRDVLAARAARVGELGGRRGRAPERDGRAADLQARRSSHGTVCRSSHGTVCRWGASNNTRPCGILGARTAIPRGPPARRGRCHAGRSSPGGQGAVPR